MRRPWTWLLLLVFVTAQLYALRTVPTRPAAAEPVARILPNPAGLLLRNGQSFLVTPTQTYRLTGSGAAPVLSPVTASWEDRPEPSGAGVWHVLVTSSGLVLMGLDGWVTGSPVDPATLFVDPGSRTPLLSSAAGRPPAPVANGGFDVQGWRWAGVVPVVVLLGQGPEGQGFYTLDTNGQLEWQFAANPATIAGFGYGNGGVVAVTRQGTIIYRGSVVNLPPEQPIWASSSGAVIGWRNGQAIWWQAGQVLGHTAAPLPLSRPLVQPGGDEAAYLSRVDDRLALVVLRPYGARVVPLSLVNARLIGWYGSDVLAAVLSGPNTGTYRIETP
jgi:hypothetical protein